MRCDEVVAALPAAADGALELSPAEWEHVEGCLACQAELVRCRRMLRSLRWLRGDVLPPTAPSLPGMLVAVQAAAEERAARSLADGRRWAQVGGFAAAAAGAAAAALAVAVLTRRHHPAGARPVIWS